MDNITLIQTARDVINVKLDVKNAVIVVFVRQVNVRLMDIVPKDPYVYLKELLLNKFAQMPENMYQ